MKHKLREWIGRYGIAESMAILFVLVFSNLIRFITGSTIIAAVITPWFENLGFYGTIAYRDLKNHKKNHGNITFGSIIKIAIGNIIEFGPAEYFDSLLLRPFFLGVFPLFIPNYTLAVFLGSMAANVTFYIPTIISYELKKKVIK